MPWERPHRPANLRSLTPAAMPVVLLAMMNGSDSEDTALVSWDRQRPAVLDAFRQPIDTFTEHAASRRRFRRARIDEYPSSQAKQRLGDAFGRHKIPGGATRLWVPAGKSTTAMRIVADEIVIEKRTDPQLAVNALLAMLERYERVMPVLSEVGMCFSTRAHRHGFKVDMTRLLRDAGSYDATR